MYLDGVLFPTKSLTKTRLRSASWKTSRAVRAQGHRSERDLFNAGTCNGCSRFSITHIVRWCL